MPETEEDPQQSSPEMDGLLRFLAFVGIAGAAAGGAGIILRALPEARVEAFKKVLAARALPILEKITAHPAFRSFDRSVLANPAGANQPVLDQIIREVGVESLGAVDFVKQLMRAEGPMGAEWQQSIQKYVLQRELDIPEHAIGAWRRMRHGDLYTAIKSGQKILPEGVDVTGINLHKISNLTGIDENRISGMRLDSWVYYNESTKQVSNLRKFHPSNLLERLSQTKVLGIPMFSVLPSQKAAGYKVGLFGGFQPEEPAHPLAMLLGGRKGQVSVVNGEAFFRDSSASEFQRVTMPHGLKLTSDFRAGEMAFRGMTSNAQYDEWYLGKQVKGLRGMLGVGSEYLPANLKGMFADVGRADYLKNARGFDYAAKWMASKAAGVLGMAGGIPIPKEAGIRLGGHSDALAGSLYVKRTGIPGFLDTLNTQVSRPFYLTNFLGIGVRPGRNPLTTLAKVSGMAMGVFAGKEALSYADWATGNIASTAGGKLLGGANWFRQELLDKIGLRSRMEEQEKETPGLFDSPLSKAARLAALGFGGAALGRVLGSKAAGGILERLAGTPRLGSKVAAGMIASLGAERAGGALVGMGVGLFAGATTMGSLTESPDSVAQKLRGERQKAYRASAGWMLGRDPYAGGRVRYFRPTLYQTAGKDVGAIGVYGSEGNKWRYGSWLPTLQNWGGLRRLFNPYYAENRNYDTRPYPATSGVGGEIPIFGPVVQSTVGSLLKPTRYRGLDTLAGMNSDAKGQAMVSGTGGPGGSGGMVGVGGTGGLASPNSLSTGASGFSKNIQEYIGLRGFQMQFAMGQLGLPSGPQGAMLAESGKMTSLARSYYDSEPGGMFGLTEGLRRFIIRPSTRPTVNTIPNSMPSWLAGSRSMFEDDRGYFRDMTRGDPYAMVPMGEARLPGPGRDAITPLHGGGTYSVVDAFLVTADVQPFTQSYGILKIEVERLIRQGKLPPEWIRRYSIAVEQAETRASFRTFHSNQYKIDAQVTVEKVLSATKFTTREHPGRIFSLGGTQLDYSEPMKLLAQRQAAGMSPAEAKMSVQADRDRLKRLLQERVGSSLAVQMTGSRNGRTEVLVPSLSGELRDMGVQEESSLYNQGPVGRAWTAAGKKTGMLGALLGGVAGMVLGHSRGFGPAQAGSHGASIGGAIVGAAVGGLAGGWFSNKFTGDFTAAEHYERFQKYGSSFADWNSPVKSFLRPWAMTAASTVTDFTPPHRARQYETEEYFDKLKFMKYQRLAEKASDDQEKYFYNQQAGQTMTGLDYSKLSTSNQNLQLAIPTNERAYFKQFSGESDPAEQARIISQVPEYMKSVYLAIWRNDRGSLGTPELENAYRQHVGPRLAEPAAQAAEYFKNHELPASGWSGWQADINIQDVKYKTIQFSGGSVHDHGMFTGQGARIDAFSPGATEAARQLAHVRPSIVRRSAMDLSRLIGSGSRVFQNRDYTRQQTNQVWLEQDDTNRMVAGAVATPGLY